MKSNIKAKCEISLWN